MEAPPLGALGMSEGFPITCWAPSGQQAEGLGWSKARGAQSDPSDQANRLNTVVENTTSRSVCQRSNSAAIAYRGAGGIAEAVVTAILGIHDGQPGHSG